MDLRMHPRVASHTLTLLLVLALSLFVNQQVSINSRAKAQKTSKTNELVSSRFKESITQFRRKLQQPVAQQKITVTNEQQVFEQQPAPIIQQQQISSVQQQAIGQSFESQQQESYESHSESIYGSVKGVPGVDFPNYSVIPNTRFSCDGVPFEPGMYADESTGCQVYHLCYQGRRESFLCGTGTLFNQAIMNCDFWHSVDCSKSSQFYSLNSEFGKSSSEPGSNWNVQSISKSFSRQAPIQSIQQQQITQQDTRFLATPPRLPSVVRSEENYQTFQQTSGKVSPPKQQFSSSFTSQSFSGGTKSIPTSSVFESQNFNSQRSEGFLSPSRKAVQLNGESIVQQQQFASAESSPMKSFASGATKSAGRSQKEYKSSVSVTSKAQSKVSTSTHQIENRVEAKRRTSNGAAKQDFRATKASSVSAVKTGISSGGDNEAWKPYFKSKTRGDNEGVTNQPVAPVHRGTSSTAAPPTTESQSEGSSTTAETPSPTLAQPDHEPTFSSNRDASSEEPSESTPSVPKSSVPPTSPEPPASTESPAVIESGVSSDLTTTTPSSPTGGSEDPTTSSAPETTVAPSSESPQTTTTAAPATDAPSSAAESSETTTAAPASSESPPAETTAQQDGTESPATTTVAPSDSPSASEQEKKKKRGVVAGVVYAGSDNTKVKSKQQTARTNSSSVVYADARPKPATRVN